MGKQTNVIDQHIKQLKKLYAVHITNLPTIAVYDRQDLRDDKGHYTHVNRAIENNVQSRFFAQGDDAQSFIDQANPDDVEGGILILLDSAGVI